MAVTQYDLNFNITATKSFRTTNPVNGRLLRFGANKDARVVFFTKSGGDTSFSTELANFYIDGAYVYDHENSTWLIEGTGFAYALENVPTRGTISSLGGFTAGFVVFTGRYKPPVET